jgi:hypothetical protein
MAQTRLAEMAALLVAELRTAVVAAEAAVPSNVRVDRVHLRLGQPRAADDEETLDVLAEEGWLVEVEFSPGGAPVVTGVTGPPPGEPGVLLVGRRSPAAIKAIDVAWVRRLTAVGVATVADLAGLPDAVVAELVRVHRSRRPVEFRTKARLLRLRLPVLAHVPESGTNLLALAGLPPGELGERLGVGVEAADRLGAALDVLVTCVDARILRQHTITDLYRSP